MKATDVLKLISAVVLALVVIFGLSYYSFELSRFFAPRQEALRRQVFEQSNAYNAGMVRDLENIRMQYEGATPAAKQVLRDVALHRFSVYPEDQLPPNLRAFYNQLRSAN